jgi:hypothetical protein
MSKKLPQSELRSETRLTNKFPYVRKIFDTQEIISRIPLGSIKLELGQKVTYKNSEGEALSTGILRAISYDGNEFISNIFDADILPSYSEVTKWWSPLVETIKISSLDCFIPSETTATLKASCKNSLNIKDSSVVWSLYFQEYENSSKELMFTGNDYESPNYCIFTKSLCNWKSGTYTIKASRYSLQNTVLKTDAYSWLYSESFSKLECGGYSNLAPLYL